MSFFTPEAFRLPNRADAEKIAARDGFGYLITASDGPEDLPFLTPLPMLIEEGQLYGHLARANPQWRLFDGKRKAQAIFPGPHGYISAAWFPNPSRAVPTWNYTMARFSGCPKVIEETDRIDRLMYRIAHRYEGDHGWQPDQTDPGFMAGMRKGIVAFEMKIETWDGKAKLSQNKPAESITRIIRHLEDHDDHDLANEMRQILIKSQ